MHPVDLDDFRAPPTAVFRPPTRTRPPRHKAGEWFLKGPIPGEWIRRASALPGHAFHVGMAVWHATAVTRGSKVKLDRFHLDRFGVRYQAGRRGLAALERAGLVAVDRHPGRRPVVTILEAPNYTDGDTATPYQEGSSGL